MCKYLSTSEVPQDSNLGLLLFSLCINYLGIVLRTNGLLYADGLLIFSSIEHVFDFEKLHSD